MIIFMGITPKRWLCGWTFSELHFTWFGWSPDNDNWKRPVRGCHNERRP